MIDVRGLPGPFKPNTSVVTVGTFDGVHRGHQEVLHHLVTAADRLQQRSVLVTFDPHPLQIVRPLEAPRVLTTRTEKDEILGAMNLDHIAFVAFTRELAAYPPARFVEEILIGHFGLSYLVIGHDHGFGRGRTGDVETLRAIGESRGFGVEVVEPFRIDGENVASSKVRARLAEGDVEAAAGALGRAYSMVGRVVRGEGQGRALGMATANLAVPDPAKLIPKEGIYAVRVRGFGGGVMHVGPRPTFEGAPASLEVHIFGFEGDLYGKDLTVEFAHRLRGVEKFGSPAELAAAMQADAVAARAFFSDHPELS